MKLGRPRATAEHERPAGDVMHNVGRYVLSLLNSSDLVGTALPQKVGFLTNVFHYTLVISLICTSFLRADNKSTNPCYHGNVNAVTTQSGVGALGLACK